MGVRGVVLVDFANRCFVLPSTCLIVEIRESRSQIDLPDPVQLPAIHILPRSVCYGPPINPRYIGTGGVGSNACLLLWDHERRFLFASFRKLPRVFRRNLVCDIFTTHRHRTDEIRIRHIFHAVVWEAASTHLIALFVSAR